MQDAVKQSTLDQSGTKPFHLKAILAPSFERDKESGRTGEIEIWWKSPTQWRREVQSPDFHQIEIVNGTQDWQKNDGDYFPEWLRETAVALVKPVPPIDHVLLEVETADIHKIAGQTHAQWMNMGTDGVVSKGIGAGIALNDSDGLVFYGDEVGWGGLFHDYQDFHGRKIARVVSVGSPEVTAKITVLEDLPTEPEDFFSGSALGNSAEPIRTQVVDEQSLRKNLLANEPIQWPQVENGPLTGAMVTTIVVDREGRVRDVGTMVSDNPALNAVAQQWISQLKFKPYLVDGLPVQAISTLTLSFKTLRPAGTESFESARTYFERGRAVGFPSAKGDAPYTLHAEFVARESSGAVMTGQYQDTWANATHWRREARLGESYLVRTEDGEDRYGLESGPDASVLSLLLHVMEPIPAIDTFVESDWKIKKQEVNGIKTIRIAVGPEDAAGRMEEGNSRAFWFDEDGKLIQAITSGAQINRSDFASFDGSQVAQLIDIRVKNTLTIRLHVDSLQLGNSLPTDKFIVKGHLYTRAFTDEVR
ncbi:energy transducer TonB [Edaphobacter dinghuensis]|uniref:energy transducer TonB n=1 Tax=Edaphobacter dinghuensis TaxID=1560005 RepID=UPI0021E0E672|nr:energy transducer TonB [Edaphobacter dinghuensis]